jgi:HNH endonuclease
MARVSKQQKRLVAERAGYCCEYCLSQEAYSPDYFSIEHVYPQAILLKHDIENLAFACQSCNNHKYTKTSAVDPLTGVIAPLFNPRIHSWEDHFSWVDDYSLIQGRTAIGRCTVTQLRLNRPAVVNLRILLASVGKHPPLRL